MLKYEFNNDDDDDYGGGDDAEAHGYGVHVRRDRIIPMPIIPTSYPLGGW